MTKAERQARRRARQERQERRQRRKVVAQVFEKQRSELSPPPNEDPLLVYDRFKNPTTVLHDYFRQPFTKRRAGFLCCGGPSYRELDSERLREPGVPTIGVNNAARDLDCDVAVFSDPAEKFHHGIMLDHKVMKLLPLPRLTDRFRVKHEDKWIQTPFRVVDCPNVFGFKRNQDFDPQSFLTAESATWGVDKKALRRGNTHEKMLNTFFLGLRIAHYLGIRRLYLVGVDFKMEVGNEYAFAGTSNNNSRASTNTNSYRIASSWCRMLAPIFEAADFQVFNCNQSSGLDTFEYVPFEEAIEDAIGSCPQRPYDFVGWYDKVDVDETWHQRNENNPSGETK